MLKGFAITPVVNGRISIGEKMEKAGKYLPVKSDEFHITANLQMNGAWVNHPIHKKITEANPHCQSSQGKLRTIPIRLLFDRPENNFRAEYTCFDQKGRPLCVGDGQTARRRMADGSIAEQQCVSAEHCEFGLDHRCKQYGRLLVGIEGEFQRDPLSGFMFRTTSFNSLRAISWRLNTTYAGTGGKLAGMPCDLKLKVKSSLGSMRQPIYYVDIEPRGSLVEAITAMHEMRKQWDEIHLDREAIETAVANGYAQSAFFESAEDGQEVVEEFAQTGGESAEDMIGREVVEHASMEETQPAAVEQVPECMGSGSGQAGLADPGTTAAPSDRETPADGTALAIEETPDYLDVLSRIKGMTDTSKYKTAEAYICNHRALSKIQKEAAMVRLNAKKMELEQTDLKQAA